MCCKDGSLLSVRLIGPSLSRDLDPEEDTASPAELGATCGFRVVTDGHWKCWSRMPGRNESFCPAESQAAAPHSLVGLDSEAALRLRTSAISKFKLGHLCPSKLHPQTAWRSNGWIEILATHKRNGVSGRTQKSRNASTYTVYLVYILVKAESLADVGERFRSWNQKKTTIPSPQHSPDKIGFGFRAGGARILLTSASAFGSAFCHKTALFPGLTFHRYNQSRSRCRCPTRNILLV